MPPRHGKSELCSHWLPTWFLTTYPERRVILASYEAEFASAWGRKVRNTISSHEDLLRVRLAGDSTAAHRWELTRGGGMMTAGVGGPMTGKGADLLVIDDPVKNAEEAASETLREKTWEWWLSTASTRLEPGGTALVIMTRWNEDDLVGRLLKQSQERWIVVDFPAIAESIDVLGRSVGDALWAERYPIDELRRMERDLGAYYWAAMYQQRPAPREGGMFKRAWFEIVRAAPARAIRIRVWDLAATEKKKTSQDPDWTAGVLLAWAMNDVIYVEHVIRFRADAPDVERVLKQTAQTDGFGITQWFQQDPGQAGKAQVAQLMKLLVGFDVKSEPKTGDKVLWAEPWAAQAGAGNVKLVLGEWNAAFLDEHAGFPNGAHDDQVDAASWGLSRLVATGRRLLQPEDDEPDDEREVKTPLDDVRLRSPVTRELNEDTDDDADWSKIA